MTVGATAVPADIPFAAVLDAGVRAAVARAAGRATNLSPAAVGHLAAALGDDLATVAAPVLLDAFARRPGRRSLSPQASAEHDAFVAWLGAGGLERLRDEHRAVEGLWTRATDAWAATVAALDARAGADAALLQARFGVALPFVAAEALIGGSAILADAAGNRVVYKHRSLGADAAFAELVAWLSSRCGTLDLHVVDLVDRGAYGWMAPVDHRPPLDCERRDYLYRTGALVALASALGAADLHVGNVRACGPHPVVLDAELVVRPRRAGDSEVPEALTSGWLPFPGYVEPSGLACEHRAAKPRPWEHAGTDAVRRRPAQPDRHRLRRLVVERLRADAALVPALLDGYAHAGRALLGGRLPLEVFEDVALRVVLRPSACYDAAIGASLRPASMVSPARRADVIAGLLADPPPSVAADGALAARVRAVEHDCVAGIHYPRFGARAADRSLWWGAERLGEPFAQSPLDRARQRLAAMGPAGLADDQRVIASALASVAAGG